MEYLLVSGLGPKKGLDSFDVSIGRSFLFNSTLFVDDALARASA